MVVNSSRELFQVYSVPFGKVAELSLIGLLYVLYPCERSGLIGQSFLRSVVSVLLLFL